MQRTDPTALLNWTQSLGQFMARHVVIIGFTILILFFLYQEGESAAEEFRRVLRHTIGERAEDYVDLATCALRASVNSMLIVGLFDGCGGSYTGSQARPICASSGPSWRASAASRCLALRGW